MKAVKAPLKRFVNAFLGKLLAERLVVPYLVFWARLVLWARKPFIIGVTGSVGKTTTTEIIGTVLTHSRATQTVGRVGWSVAGNDLPGLARTVLRLGSFDGDLPDEFIRLCLLPLRTLHLAVTSRYPRLLVLEYGTAGPGQIQELCNLARPRIAVVTTIGEAHLEGLQTIEGVLEEKSDLLRAVPPSGWVILGQDHPHVFELERRAMAPVTKVTGRGRELSENIARAVCRCLGVPEEVTTSALAGYVPPRGRLNRLTFPDLTLIDDSYNANPLSMRLGLDTLMQTAEPGQRRLAILGFMAELGQDARTYHEQIGAYARNRADVVIGIGDLARHYDPHHWFDTSDACGEQIEALVGPGDCVLVKGSHSARMAAIVDRLRQVALKRSSTSSVRAEHPAPAAAIQARSLDKRFRRGTGAWAGREARRESEFWALRDVSFEVARGEAFGIIGHNGSGKSTLLKILSGVMTPTRGSVEVRGRLSGLIEVGAGFHEDLTGRENIFLNGTILGMTREEIRRKFDAIVDFSGMEAFLDTPVKRYSSGMYARLGFAVAVHVEPDVLLVDEVLSVGDNLFQRKGVEKMRSIVARGTTVVFVSHNLHAVASVCQRAMLLERGAVTAVGPTSEVIHRYLERDAPDPPQGGAEKEACLTRVTLRGVAGEALRFESGGRAYVDVEVTARRRCEQLAVGIECLDEDRYVAFRTSTRRLGEAPFSLEAGESFLTTFELQLNLAPGTFQFGAYLYRHDTEQPCGARRRTATFYVTSAIDVKGIANLEPRVIAARVNR